MLNTNETDHSRSIFLVIDQFDSTILHVEAFFRWTMRGHGFIQLQIGVVNEGILIVVIVSVFYNTLAFLREDKR